MNNNVRQLCYGTLLLLSAPCALAQQSNASHYSVHAMPIGQAVEQLQRASGTSIVLDMSVDAAISSHAASNAQSVEQALDAMLEGTGLTWVAAGEGTYAIMDAATAGGGDATASAGGSGQGDSAQADQSLDTVNVETSADEGGPYFGDADTFGVGAGANGSTDATATEGTNSLTSKYSSVAGKSPTALQDTPATVRIVTQTQMRQQNLDNASDALAATPGVTVRKGASGARERYYSRGFQITSYQQDGGAASQMPGAGPARGPVTSSSSLPDLSAYDHTELIQGADALFAGASNPSGVINLQRKRPTDHQQVNMDLEAGSWNKKRAVFDASSPLAFDGRLRGRIVGAQENDGEYSRYAKHRSTNLYAVLEGDITSSTILRGGFQWNQKHDRSPNLFGVPRGDDGSDLNLPRKTNFTAPWAYDKSSNREFFAELEQNFGHGVTGNLKYNHSRAHSDMQYPEIQGAYVPGPRVPSDGYFGLSQTNFNHATQTEDKLDGSLTSKFQWLGHEQKIVVGGDYSHNKMPGFTDNYSTSPALNLDPYHYNPGSIGGYSTPTPGRYPEGAEFNGEPLRETTNFEHQPAEEHSTQKGAYAGIYLTPIDKLHLELGLRKTWLDYGNSNSKVTTQDINGTPTIVEGSRQSDSESVSGLSRHYSLAYDLTDNFTPYVSYDDIVNTQSFYRTVDGALLPLQRGKTFQLGTNMNFFDGALTGQIAYFWQRNENQPISTGDFVENTLDAAYIPGGTVKSDGLDITLSGALTSRWQVNAGYTFVETHYNQDYKDNASGSEVSNAQSQSPKHQFKLWSSYDLPGVLEGATVFGGVRMESKRTNAGMVCAGSTTSSGLFGDQTSCNGNMKPYDFSQPFYAVADIGGSYQVNKNLSFALNITNLFDRHYYETMYDTTSRNFYGEPRAVTLSMHSSF
ncbi:TonB-dependent siderophore receptor [Carnimonas bestiolae]|uniref:TonB-dependent siderophore receptor n=1 Tax=Carnimonas bestiolae TaxID=3402172 RepID=UPI003EDC2FF1